MSVATLTVKDNSNDERYPFIFKNEPNDGQEQLVSLFVHTVARDSPCYNIDEKVDTKVDLRFGALCMYWKPKTMANLMHFLTSQKQSRKEAKKAQKTNAVLQLDESVDSIALLDSKVGAEVPAKKIQNCGDFPHKEIQINLQLARLTAIFIHPLNNTYPVFTLEVETIGVTYNKRCDCDQVNANLKNFLIFDNTSYPNTLDPFKLYSSADVAPTFEIMGVNQERNQGKPMLELELYAFTYPGKDGGCQYQVDKGFNVQLGAELQQLRLIYMQQCTLRMVDYFMVQVIGLLVKNASGAPDAQQVSLLEEEEEFSPLVNKIPGTSPFWQMFDLKQSPYCPGLNINIQSPLIVIPDLESAFGGFNKRFELDLGKVKITTKPVDQAGRWKHFPSKTVKMMQINIENTDLKFEFKDHSGTKYKPIFYEKKIELVVLIPNASPFFVKEDSAEYTGPIVVDSDGNMFDPEFVDSSISVKVSQKLFRVVIMQTVMQEMFGLLDNNIKKQDQFTDHFLVAIKNKRMKSSSHASVQSMRMDSVSLQSSVAAIEEEGMSFEEQKMSKTIQSEVSTSQLISSPLIPYDNQKSIGCLFHFYCLAIELRNNDDKLVCEFCLLNTDVGYDAFDSGRSSVFVRSHSFFILHAENTKMQTKQVLVGSHDDRNIVFTDENFYTQRPEELRKKLWFGVSNEMNPAKLKLNFSLELPSPKNPDGEMLVNIQLKKLRIFLRLEVFNELSQFAIQGLDRMNKQNAQQSQVQEKPVAEAKKEKTEEEKQEVSGRMRVKVSLSDFIACSEYKELTKKVLVLKMNAKVEMASIDENYLKKDIERRNKHQTTTKVSELSVIDVKVEELTPYFVDMNELSNSTFKRAKKRELITPLSSLVIIKTDIAPYIDGKSKMSGDFDKHSSISCFLSSIIVKVSMDDLYILNSMSSHLSKQAMEVSKLWGDYSQRISDARLDGVNNALKANKKLFEQALIKRIQQEASPSMQRKTCTHFVGDKNQLLIESEDRMRSATIKVSESGENAQMVQDNKVEFECERVELIVIDEYQGNFLPMILFQVDKVSFNQKIKTMGVHETMEGQADISCKMQYFNAPVGQWEPAIEQLKLTVKLEGNGKAQKQVISAVTPLNINVSVGLAGVLANFQNLWTMSTQKALKFQKLQEEKEQEILAKIDNSDVQSVNLSLFSDSQLKNRVMPVSDLTSEISQNQIEEEEIVTPYAIRNVTNMPIYVYTLSNAEYTKENQVQIKPGKMKDIAVQINMHQKNDKALDNASKQLIIEEEKMMVDSVFNKNDQITSVTSQIVRIEFHEKSMTPVQRVNLEQSNSTMIHRVFSENIKSKLGQIVVQQNISNQKLPREFYVLQKALESHKTVLTIRTQHILINETEISYNVRIFWIDKVNKKYKIVEEVKLEKGKMTSLPDNPDIELQKMMKISIQPEFTNKWSDEFKLQALKDKLETNKNIIWGHSRTYSILRKVPTDKPGVFNFCIMPPMIVMNCLPCTIQLKVSQVTDTTLSSKSQVEENKQQDKKTLDAPIENYELLRGEEKQLAQIQQTTAQIGLTAQLGPEFKSAMIKLFADKSAELDIAVKAVDRFQREFQFRAKIDTQKAGVRIVFYAENCLISHTEEMLNFFTQRKPGLFEADNANQFPEPVYHVKGRTSKKGKNNLDEPLVYIFNDTRKIFCALKDQPRVVSDAAFIQQPGVTEKITIARDQYEYEYSVTTSVYQASPKDDVFTKVVEVAPLYVLVNMTSSELKVAQSYVNDPGQANVLPLAPKERTSFRWSDGQQPKLIKFIADDFVLWSADITLEDAGALPVQNIKANGDKRFFKVTKKNQQGSLFVIFEDLAQPPYIINNKCIELFATVVQKGYTRPEFIVDVAPESKMPFTWSSLEGERLVHVTFNLEGSELKMAAAAETLTEEKSFRKNKPLMQKIRDKQLQSEQIYFSLDTLNTTQQVDLIKGNITFTVYVSVYADEYTKVIEFSFEPSTKIFETRRDKQKKQSDNFQRIEESKSGLEVVEKQLELLDPFKDPTTPSNQVNLTLSEAHLSFLRQGIELFTFNVMGLSLSMLMVNDEQILEFAVNRVQLDNTAQLDPLFPVVLKPKCTAGEKPHNHETMEGVDPVIQFYLSMRTGIPKITYITMFEFLIKEIELKMEINHLMSILDFLSDYNDQSNAGIYSSHAIFHDKHAVKSSQSEFEEYDVGDTEKDLHLETWRLSNVESQEDIVYIEKYKGSPIVILISVFMQSEQKAKDQGKSRGAQILERVGSLGLNLTSINDAPLTLNALEIPNVYGPYYIVQNQLMDHYMSNIKANVIRLLGSSDLIGNPINLTRTLGQGTKDFFYEPVNGAMQGPVEAGIGVIKGTWSLGSHAVGGTAGVLGRFTNSINKGLVTLSFDEEYRKKKEFEGIKEKPTGFIDGTGKGIKSFGLSIGSAIGGVFTKPVEGAKNDGVKGFFKGFGKGTAGLVVKPISGVVDIFSKTAQGIENSVQGGDCVPNGQRCRKPRAFYKQENLFQDFSLLHSEVYFVLKNPNVNIPQVRQQIEAKDKFYEAFRLTRNGSLNDKIIETPVLVLTKNCLYCLDEKLQFQWMRKSVDLLKAQAQQNELWVWFNQKAELNGFGKIQRGKEIEIQMHQSSQGPVQTVVFYLENQTKAKKADEVLAEIKSVLMFELNEFNLLSNE